MDRLHRTRLLFGDAGVEKLKKSTIMVVGCGAVGSFAIEALARTGIGHIIVVDFDVVEESNINRQLFALESTIGMNKVHVAMARVRDINPDIKNKIIALIQLKTIPAIKTINFSIKLLFSSTLSFFIFLSFTSLSAIETYPPIGKILKE